jgi:hypothetical protein
MAARAKAERWLAVYAELNALINEMTPATSEYDDVAGAISVALKQYVRARNTSSGVAPRGAVKPLAKVVPIGTPTVPRVYRRPR